MKGWIFENDDEDFYRKQELKRKFRYLKVIRKNFLNDYENFLIDKALSGVNLNRTELKRFKMIMRVVDVWFDFLDKENYKNIFSVLEKELYKKYFLGSLGLSRIKLTLSETSLDWIAEICRLDGNRNVYFDILKSWIKQKNLKDTARELGYSVHFVRYVIDEVIYFLSGCSVDGLKKFGKLLIELKKNSNYRLSFEDKEKVGRLK